MNPTNSVNVLQNINFRHLTLHDKIQIKNNGRETPDIVIKTKAISNKKQYTRSFNRNIYEKYDWITGCEKTNKLYCFPCLLFGGEDAWIKYGVDDLNHINVKVSKHEKNKSHVNNRIDLSMLGRVNIMTQIDTGYQRSISAHNDIVRKNRDVLSKILNCVKFCGKFELPLRGHSETEESENPGVFLGLIDFACQLDTSLQTHFTNATVFKGTSKIVQNDLLDSCLKVCKNKIKLEIQKADYLAVMCDETTDTYGKIQMVIVLRYELCGKPVERFWGFLNPVDQRAETLAELLISELNVLVGQCTNKLIAQCYDGAATMSGVKTGVQQRIKETYKNAHFIHCYAHQLNLILKQATSQNSSVRVFFNELSAIPTFFSQSPQRLSKLEEFSGKARVPRPSDVRWKFKIRTVNAVSEQKENFIKCCDILETSRSESTGSGAVGIKRSLTDPDFDFWLNFFSKLMSHVDILYNQFQSRNIDPVKADRDISCFTSAIQKIRNECDNMNNPTENKRRKIDKPTAAKEVCDIVLCQCKERLQFIDHLLASKLLDIHQFSTYTKCFPADELNTAVRSYPMLDKEKLRSELSVLYSRPDICTTENIVAFLKILIENELHSTFSETIKLIKILITTPMTTCEAERCFSTLKRVKTFIRSTMEQERLTALAMMSIEKKLVNEITDFNEHVIDNFAAEKNRRMDFKFK